jgi:hypothetical protein
MVEVTRILDLLESNYRIGDTKSVRDAVQELRKGKHDPHRLLTNERWEENTARLEKEIEIQSKMPVSERRNGVLVQLIDSKFDVVSAIGRKLAWSGDCGIAVALNTGFLENYDQLYIRQGTNPIDTPRLIEKAHHRGYSAGGKAEVAGIVVPKQDTRSFLYEILNFLVNELSIQN